LQILLVLAERIILFAFRCANGFSRKRENRKAAASLHFCHCYFVRLLKSLRITMSEETRT